MEPPALPLHDDAMFVLDGTGTVRSANQPAGRLVGAACADLAGRPAESLFGPCGWVAELADSAGLQAARGRLELQRADGSHAAMAAAATAVPAARGARQIVLTLSPASRSALEQKLAHRALHDPLTGLANRSLFGAQLAMALAEAEAQPHQVAVLLMDIDRFKSINDVLGHKSGDALIRLFGARLKAVLGLRELVARLGGDEFAIVCPVVDEPDYALRMAARIVEIMKAPFDLLGEQVVVSTSVGVAFAGGEARADDLVRDADSAMYRAKRQGAGRFEAFDEAASRHSLGRRAIEAALREALGRSDRLDLALEPVVSLRTDDVVDIEALLRWQGEELSAVPIAQLVEVAEESGLIVDIEREVLRVACRRAAAWLEAGGEGPGVSVNLSHRHVLLPRFRASVEEALAESGLSPAKLSLEIPDSVFAADDPATRAAFEHLARLGVRLVLNDFGRGRCALRQLSRWPLDGVKLDRELVAAAAYEGRDRRLLAAVVDMARAMDLKVVAKGVETYSQLQAVVEVGCDAAQGRRFADRSPARSQSPAKEAPK